MKKLFIWLLIVAFAVSMAFMEIGCKKAEEVASVEEVTEAEGVKEEAEQAVEEETPIKLEWWVFSWEFETGAPQEIVKRFNEKFPNIGVEVVSNTYEGYEDKVSMRGKTETLPDLLETHSTTLGKYAPGGIFMDVTEVIEDMGGSDYFSEGALTTVKYNDKYCGFPYRISAQMLVWNKDIFKEAGLDPETPPKTWDEVMSFAKQITENTGSVGFALSGKRPHVPSEFRRLVNIFGGDFVDDPQNPTKATIAELPGIEAGKFYQELSQSGVLQNSVLSDTMDTCRDLFNAGRVGMFISNTPFLVLIEEAGINYGQATLPGYKAGEIGGESPMAFMLNISANTEYAQEALEFARFISEPEQNAFYTPALPTVKEAAKLEKFEDPKYAVSLEQINYNTVSALLFLEAAEVDVVVEEAVQKILMGEDVEQALNAASEAINGILQK